MNHLVVSNEINGACHTWTPIKNLCTHKIDVNRFFTGVLMKGCMYCNLNALIILFVILTGGIRPMNCNCITVQFQIVRAV